MFVTNADRRIILIVTNFQQGHREPDGFGVSNNILYFKNFMLGLGTLIPNFISQITGNEGE
jgi:hypothetical protein